jgi:protein-S-isoprenylcysteine O-methyltransferase Ste14
MLKLILPLYLLLYLATAFFWRSYLIWQRTGRNPFVLGRSDSVHDFVGKLFTLTIGLTTATVLVYALAGEWYAYLMPFTWLESPLLVAAGLALLLLSWLWTLLAQAQMGNAWRIGIDQQVKTELIQSGIFGRSRNPIFLGMITTLLGLFLVIPSALTLLELALTFTLIHIQVRLEEEFLRQQHGDHYLTYCHQVPRWL